MGTIDRIEQDTDGKVINLTDTEKDIYTGSGWKLARFVDGQLVEFFDPILLEYPREYDAQEIADGAIRSAIVWLKNIESGNAARSYTNGQRDGGEAWLVMCSDYQLCAPCRVTLNDAVALEHMAQIFRRFSAYSWRNCNKAVSRQDAKKGNYHDRKRSRYC